MNKLHAALPTVAKKCVWNMKHGFLGYAHFVAPDDVVRYLLAQLSRTSTVLDLGCGRGSLLWALRENGWTGNYCGVDISQRPINDARKMADQRSFWVVSDIESFYSPLRWDVIALVESIYYIKLGDLPGFLNRLTEMLNHEGTLVFRLHDLEKYREYVEAILSLYPHTEKVGPNLFCIRRSVPPSNR